MPCSYSGGDAEHTEHLLSTSPLPFHFCLWSLVWGNTVFQTTLREIYPIKLLLLPHRPLLSSILLLSGPSATSLRQCFHCFFHTADKHICCGSIIFRAGIYLNQDSCHNAHVLKMPVRALKHLVAQPGTAPGRTRHRHYLCNQHQVSQPHRGITAKMEEPQAHDPTPS